MCLLAVFPTPVGVFLGATYYFAFEACLPHARGGVSNAVGFLFFENSSSPRPWGCFSWLLSIVRSTYVFPTPVGVFPRCSQCRILLSGLPHARGGVSKVIAVLCAGHGSSPRPWGCFYKTKTGYALDWVFPTPVGVFPKRLEPLKQFYRLPHARGGVSC